MIMFDPYAIRLTPAYQVMLAPYAKDLKRYNQDNIPDNFVAVNNGMNRLLENMANDDK